MVDPDSSQSQSVLFNEASRCLGYGEFCVQALYNSIDTTVFKSVVLLVMTEHSPRNALKCISQILIQPCLTACCN